MPRVFPPFAAVALVAVLGGRCPAAETDRTALEKELDGLVDRIKDVLDKAKATEVTFGEFKCRDQKDDPCAAGLQRKIELRLTRFKFAVAAKARFELHAEYGYEPGAGAELTRFKVTVRLRETGRGADTPFKLDADLTTHDMRDLLTYYGGCVSLDPDGTKESRNGEFEKARVRPTGRVHLGGELKTRVSSTPTSPYFVELVAGPKDGKGPLAPRKAGVADGVAVAAVEKDEEYRVRIGNTSGREVACRVTIDGVDLFEFSDDTRPDGSPRYRHVLVPAGTAETPRVVTVPGWHKTADPRRADNWRAFLVTDLGLGAASLVKAKGRVGQIAVSFARSYDPTDPARSRDATETGVGRPLTGQQTPQVRAIDPPHDLVTVRYTRGVDPR